MVEDCRSTACTCAPTEHSVARVLAAVRYEERLVGRGDVAQLGTDSQLGLSRGWGLREEARQGVTPGSPN